jgi:hypothetical protein
MTKPIYKSKTFWVNLIITIVAILTCLSDFSLIKDNPETVALIGTFIGALNIVLRCVTKEPIK